MTEWGIFWIALAAIAVGISLATGVGLYVVSAHPNPSDPARNARRFVIPAGVGAFVAFVAALIWIGSIVALIIP
jgi:hypothetical protein